MIESVLAFSVVPEGVGDPVRFFVLAALAVMLVGAAKAGFAGGVGMLSTPLMIYACHGSANAAALAVGIMLPLLIACDYVTMFLWWRRWSYRPVLLLLPGMVLGVAAGWAAMWAFQQYAGGTTGHESKTTNTILTLAIGLIAIGFVVLRVLRAVKGDLKPFKPNLAHGTLAGSVGGLTSTLAHAAGPIIAMYMIPQRLPKDRFVATTVLYYWIGNQVKLLPYWKLNLLKTPALMADVALLPAVVIGALLGVILHNRVNEKVFALVVYVLLAAAGAHLTIVSTISLLGS